MENFSKILLDVLTAVITAGLTFLGFWRKAKADLEQEYLKRFNDKKWDVYTEFTKSLQEFLADKETDFSDPVHRSSEETALASQLVLIGSDEVVKAFRAWRETSMVYGRSQKEAKDKLFMLVATMRNDLGIKYSKLEVDDLLGALEPGFVRS
jgi:hypothetical protein